MVVFIPPERDGSPLPLALPEFGMAKAKLDELFVLWLAQRETGELFKSIADAAANGRTIFAPPLPFALSQAFGGANASSQPPPDSPERRSGWRSPVNTAGPPRSPTGRHSQSPPPSAAAQSVVPASPTRHPPSPRSAAATAPSQRPPSPSAVRKNPEEAGAAQLPAFFVRGEGGRGRGRPAYEDRLEAKRVDIEAVWGSEVEIGPTEFVTVTRDLCGLPSLFNRPLMARILKLYCPERVPLPPLAELSVPLELFLRYWRDEVEPFDVEARFFRLLKQPAAAWAVREDLMPFVDELIHFHPGLQFLSSHAEFQEKYALTVATRFLYSVNLSRTGLVSERELRRSGVLDVWRQVDTEEDINRVTHLFSYEHFYVLYCRYWELDSDHDGRISREDLLKYGSHRLSRSIVDRVFEVGFRPRPGPAPIDPTPMGPAAGPSKDPTTGTSGGASAGTAEGTAEGPAEVSTEGLTAGTTAGASGNVPAASLAVSAAGPAAADPAPVSEVAVDRTVMLYDDFVYFMLAEEDKGSAQALGYWFQCVDLDGDGALTAADMRPFYDTQAQRMDALGHEPIAFADLLCQMSDSIQPGEAGRITLRDLCQRHVLGHAGTLFDALFNLDKFLGFEQRDPFAERHKRDDPFDSDWDRFAYAEYNRLAQEEEAREEMDVHEWGS